MQDRRIKWSEEEVALLTDLWSVKKKSSGEIGIIMSRSRNSIMGQVHRLGLDARPTGMSRRGQVKPSTPRIRKPRPVRIAKPAKPARPPKSLKRPDKPFVLKPYRVADRKPPQYVAPVQKWAGYGVHLLETTHGQCRAILGSSNDPRGLAICCGKPIKEGANFAFCPEHYAEYITNPWR